MPRIRRETTEEAPAVEVQNGRDVNAAKRSDKEIVVTFAEPIPPGHETRLTIRYSAQPIQGLYFRVPSNGYRAEDMHIGNLLTALSCLDAGTTTIIDASHNARSPEHTDACLDALGEAGIRALHMPGRPLAGDWAEHWPHDLARLKRDRRAAWRGECRIERRVGGVASSCLGPAGRRS